jgi:hypothetical protein
MIPASSPNLSNVSTACPHCGLYHATTCPLVKAIEYHPNGQVKRVEFKTAMDWPQVQQQMPQWQSPIVSNAMQFIS